MMHCIVGLLGDSNGYTYYYISGIRNLTEFQSNSILWRKQSSEPTLTSHGAESKQLVCVIVMGGTTPSHAIASPIRGAVGVVAATVEEGELAQGTVRVSTSCCYNGWIMEGTQQLLCISDLVALFQHTTMSCL